MTDIQTAINLLIGSFSKYAGKEGDPHSLTKVELKDLLQSELSELLGKANDKEAVEKIFKAMDANADNTVDFEEFVKMVACLAVMCHDFFCKH